MVYAHELEQYQNAIRAGGVPSPRPVEPEPSVGSKTAPSLLTALLRMASCLDPLRKPSGHQPSMAVAQIA